MTDTQATAPPTTTRTRIRQSERVQVEIPEHIRHKGQYRYKQRHPALVKANSNAYYQRNKAEIKAKRRARYAAQKRAREATAAVAAAAAVAATAAST